MPYDFVLPEELPGFLNDTPGLLMIDVRDADAFASAHYPGSSSIPLEQLQAQGLDTNSADQPVLLICQLGKRAQMAAQALESQHENPLYVLTGGLAACVEAGIALSSRA